MDPNTTRIEAVKLATRIMRGTAIPTRDEAEELAELVLALDEWLCKGGFLPAAWEANRP